MHSTVDAEPSGWLHTYSVSEELMLLPRVKPHDLAQYYLDDGRMIGPHKDALKRLLCAWDDCSITSDQFTLCPSGAFASLITLAVLRDHGIQRVAFETPCYFANVEQAEKLGLDIQLLPTYRKDAYALPSLKRYRALSKPVAIWLTQPRIALGWNQPLNAVADVLERVGSSGFVIIDEVADQLFPAHLGKLHDSFPRNLIRLRSFTKAMGLNGLRVSAITHPTSLRRPFIRAVELFGGTIDAYSLFAVNGLSADMHRFQTMLAAANLQVNTVRVKADTLVRGSRIGINPLVNGFFGSMVIDVTQFGHTHRERREGFLAGCRAIRTPVILGSSFYMAKDPPLEGIRLNFLMPEDHILRGIANIVRLVA